MKILGRNWRVQQTDEDNSWPCFLVSAVKFSAFTVIPCMACGRFSSGPWGRLCSLVAWFYCRGDVPQTLRFLNEVVLLCLHQNPYQAFPWLPRCDVLWTVPGIFSVSSTTSTAANICVYNIRPPHGGQMRYSPMWTVIYRSKVKSVF